MGKREEVTSFLVKGVNNIVPGYKKSGELLEATLNRLTDAEFDSFIRRLRSKKELAVGETQAIIPFYLPILRKERVSIARCFKLVRDLGRSLTHRLVMTDSHTGVRYLTPHPYPCFDISIRRQAQTGLKKRSIPGVRQAVDDLSGQPTALSKGGRVSSSEAKFLDSRGFKDVQNELIHVRGGSVASYREFKRELFQTGEVDLSSLQGLGPAKSTQVLSAYLNGMGLGNNILPGTAIPEDALPKKDR